MRILTGITPSADQVHIGNYFGAIKPMLDLKQIHKDAEFFLFLSNMHALTKVFDGQELKQNSINIIKIYLACNANPKDFFIYNQADVPAHAQLTWVMQCITHMGFMERMHAYKDSINKKKAGEIGIGVFTYPILMAVDILLYDANIVPVGKDQKQHVEFTRDIAQKFNTMYGETFVLPDPYIQESVATVPGIDGRKMSKSYNNYIGLLDDEKVIAKKIKQITTSMIPVEEPKDPDTCNIYALLKLFMDNGELADIRSKYTMGGLSYKFAKDLLYEKVIHFLSPIQKVYTNISDQEVITMLSNNKERANDIANKKQTEVYKKVGFILS